MSAYGFLDDLRRDRARATGKPTYKGEQCNVRGHSCGDFSQRYTHGRGCVLCSEARAAAKASPRASAPRGLSATPEYRLWIAARGRAEKKNLKFTIKVSDIVIPDLCPVFGTPLESPSIDRFDNAKGYTPDNIRVISRRANRIKSDATSEEVLAVAKYMIDGYLESFFG